MSNLIKSNAIRFQQSNQWVIDSNSRQELFQAVSFTRPRTERNETGDPSECQGFVEGLLFADTEEVTVDDTENQQKILEETSEIVSQMLEEARAESDKMLQEAKINAEVLSTQILEEAKKEGFSQGLEQGQQYIKAQEEKLDQKLTQMQIEYEKKVTNLEPQFVGLTAALIEKVTGILVEDKKDVILYLMQNILSGSERSGTYVLKVSKEDYPYVEENLDKLKAVIRSEAKVELYEENTLMKNQCLIETDGSVIDCSLGVQLENLTTELKLLSLT